LRLIGLATVAVVLIAMSMPVAAQEIVYVIRHAEKEPSGADPVLTPAGERRASTWARFLELAGLDAVLTSEAKRSRQTGSIIAGLPRLETRAATGMDGIALADIAQFDYEDSRLLIVGHTETIPGILKGLGVQEPVEVRAEEFDRLFILFNTGSDDAQLVSLRMTESF
jgi:phosphohistidine phosphatase SixA